MIEKVLFDNPESAKFFSHFIHNKGDMTLSADTFHDIVADAENKFPLADHINNTSKGAYKIVFKLGGTDSKYAKGLGTFTVYYDSNDNAIGLFDRYDFDMHTATFRDYTGDFFQDLQIWNGKTIFGITDRSFIGEWQTRGMSSLNYIGVGSSYKISYP